MGDGLPGLILASGGLLDNVLKRVTAKHRTGATPCALEHLLQEQKSLGYEGGFLYAVGSVRVLVLAHSCSRGSGGVEKASLY
jgi:hypothetical protein